MIATVAPLPRVAGADVRAEGLCSCAGLYPKPPGNTSPTARTWASVLGVRSVRSSDRHRYVCGFGGAAHTSRTDGVAAATAGASAHSATTAAPAAITRPVAPANA